MKGKMIKISLVIFIVLFIQYLAYANEIPNKPKLIIPIKASIPLRTSTSIGISLFSIEKNSKSGFKEEKEISLFEYKKMDFFSRKKGMLLQIEPGLSGGKLNFGVYENDFLGLAAIKLSFLKTWNNPIGLKNDQSYLGFDFELLINFIDFNLGIYRHIAGNDDNHNYTPSIGLGVIF